MITLYLESRRIICKYIMAFYVIQVPIFFNPGSKMTSAILNYEVPAACH